MRPPDFQEVLFSNTLANEVVLNLPSSVCPLPQPDQVSIDLFAQRSHRGDGRLHVLVIQTTVAPIWKREGGRGDVRERENGFIKQEKLNIILFISNTCDEKGLQIAEEEVVFFLSNK